MMSGFLAATVFLQWTPAGWLADVVLAGVVVASIILLQEEASAVTGPMPEKLTAGIISQGPPTRVVGDVVNGEQVVRKTVAAGTLVGRTRFGKLWGAESIRAQEAALIKLGNAGIDTAKIRQSFSETGELILDYAGKSVDDQWATMSGPAREAFYGFVDAAKDVMGYPHDLKRRNIAYQPLEVDGQVTDRVRRTGLPGTVRPLA
jgi:hypothetical protein